MLVEQTPLEGVFLFKPKVHGDHRGFFVELFRENAYAEAGLTARFVQDNHSRSGKGILRGMHYQYPDCQGKLVSVVYGSVFDVVVDVRKDSPQFGQWFGTVLDDTYQHQLWVPPGFAHGFLVLSDMADFIYKCTEYYKPEQDAGFCWNDPDVGIKWPISTPPITSDKDNSSPLLAEIPQSLLPLSCGKHI